jgi:tRNA(Met) C34 N-acetyltransferase TmcA
MRHPRFTLAVRGQVIPEPVCSHHLAGRVAELSTNGCRVVNVATIPDPEEEPCPD